MRWRRRTLKQKRDKAIADASDALHEAVRQLWLAHMLSADMGDPDLADDLWKIRDDIPFVSRQVDAYLYDWAATMQPPPRNPKTPVRQRQ